MIVRQKNRFLIGWILSVVFTVFSSADAGEGPDVSVLVGEEAPALERYAAAELAGLLTKLFDATVSVQSKADSPSEATILLGSPETNPEVREVMGEDWPELSEQGHLLKSIQRDGTNLLIVGGGSPIATLWAVYELGHHFGVRYTLQEDYLPIDAPEFTLAGFNEILEPNIRVRAWRSFDPGIAGQESWGLEDHRKLFRQLIELKFNGIAVVRQADDWMPAKGIPVTGDTAGRSVFDGVQVFENPDYEGEDVAKKRLDEAQRLIASLGGIARELGLSPITENDQGEFPDLETLTLGSQGGGVLPQFFTSRLPKKLATIRNSDAEGFAVQCWIPGNLNPDIYYLSRASFDSDISPQKALDDLVTPICGEGVADRLNNGFVAIEKVSALIEKEDSSFAVPDPNMFMEHFESAEPAPEWWATATEHYGTGVNEMYRGNTRARGGARSFILYHAKYFTFALHYMTAVDAVRKAGVAKSEKNSEAWVENLELAVEAMHNALAIYSEVARDNSDRGTIAVLNEYAYRPLVEALNEAPLP